MIRRSTTLAILVAIAVALLGGVATAEDKQARKLAEKHFFAGERAYRAQSFLAAAAQFEEAYKALPLPEIAYSAAQAYRRHYRVEPRLRYAKRAVELYRIYLRAGKKGRQVGLAADYIGEMQREVDKLVAAGARVARESVEERTRLGVSPVLAGERGGIDEIGDIADETSVELVTEIDGKQVPPFEMIDVEPGPHVVRVEAEGYLPHESTERVVKGASTVAEIVMKPRPARLAIETERGAQIRIDGRAAGTAPLAALELPAGKHVVTILKRGREPVSREIEVTRGQELAIAAPLAKTGRRRAVPFVLAGAIAFTALTAAGVTFAIVEDGRAGDQLAAIQAGDQVPAAAARYDELIDRRDELITGAAITGGVALLLGGTAAALYWLDRPSEDSVRSIQVVPTAGGARAGIAVTGRF